MRPIKLRFQGFASYCEAAEIDFEKLDSLFLICGETGAGKTAVLDAMTFALYGESSGGERGEFRCVLPSAADIPTEVEFIFEIRGRRYKFTRGIFVTPRSKKTEQRQDCFYLDDSGEYRAFFENPKQSFVKQKAEELTGLSAEQFRQVIILPQGRFERLLTSDSADKEKILSTLFCTEKYSRLSDKLSEQAETERRALDAEAAALKNMLAGENADTPEKLNGEILALSGRAEQLAPKLAEAKAAFSAAQEALTAAELLSERFSALNAARSRLAALNERSAEIGDMSAALSAHENAAKAKPEYAALLSAEDMLKRREDRLEISEQSAKAAESEYETLSETREEFSALERDNAAKTEALAALNALSAVYERVGVSEAAAKRLAAELSECEKYRGLYVKALADTEENIARIEEEQREITEKFSRALPELLKRKTALEGGFQAAKKLARFTAELEKIGKTAEALTAAAEAAETPKAAAEAEYDRLYGAYLSNTAAELSSRLKEGEPCPVCGSLSHPAPAEKSADAVTAEDVRAARDKFEAAAKALSDIRAKIAAEQARIPNARIYIREQEEIIAETRYTAEELQKIAADYAEAERRNALLPNLDKQLAELRGQKRSLEDTAKGAEERRSELKQSLVRAEADHSALKSQLDPTCPDRSSYAAKTAALREEIAEFSRKKQAFEDRYKSAEKRKIETAAALEQAKAEKISALKQRKKTSEEFSKRLSELNIPDADGYKAALLDEEKALFCAAETKRFAMESHAVSESLSSLEAELAGKLAPNLSEAKALCEKTSGEFADLSRQEAVCAERLSRLKRLSRDYSARMKKHRAAREKSDKRAAFAKFMRGDKGTSFTRYVLGIMLRLVASEANRILADVYGGKFRLCVKSELAANSKQGLDLEVENTTLSAAVRYGVKNLSGGEKFLISLALSLGLSAVAQSRAGGIEIESMFIDEGFGSLDPNSLREAINILCGLSTGRNTVGIISHIEELQTVIPCKISVKKSPNGGSVIQK